MPLVARFEISSQTFRKRNFTLRVASPLKSDIQRVRYLFVSIVSARFARGEPWSKIFHYPAYAFSHQFIFEQVLIKEEQNQQLFRVL